jgi:hypothetical protein
VFNHFEHTKVDFLTKSYTVRLFEKIEGNERDISFFGFDADKKGLAKAKKMMVIFFKKVKGKSFRFLFFETNQSGKMTKDFSFEAKINSNNNYELVVSTYETNSKPVKLEAKDDMSCEDIFEYVFQYMLFSVDFVLDTKKMIDENVSHFISKIKTC